MTRGEILVVNSGSATVKLSLFRRGEGGDWEASVRGQIDGNGAAAMDAVAAWLQPHLEGEPLLAAGHRVVHGGSKYSRPVRLDREVLGELKEFIPLVPLHQPYNLAVIETLLERMPDLPQVACFDTAFHRGRALVTEILPLPWEFYESGVRRYAFHGLSYEYVASVLPQVAPEIASGRVVVAHLGSGASLAAMHNLKCADSTLSFTALDGMCMGTRPGAIDPGVILYLFQSRGLSVGEVDRILYKESGLKGISGISNDMRDLLASREPRAQLAIEYFIYRVAKEIGAMAAVLGGLDGLVFTAGIGENAPEIRRRICASCAWLGLVLDEEANARGEARISAAASRVAAWVIPTNEELMIARHTAAVLGLG